MDIIYSINTAIHELYTQGNFDMERIRALALSISALPQEEQDVVVTFLLSGLIVNKIFFCSTKYCILKEYINIIKEKDPFDVVSNSSIIVTSLYYTDNNNSYNYSLIKLLDTMYPIDWSVLINNKNFTIVSYYMKKIETNYDEDSFNILKYIVDKGNFINPEDTTNIRLMFQRYASKYDQLKPYSETYPYMNESHITQIKNIVSSSKGQVLKHISEYALKHKLNINELLNIKDINNVGILGWCKSYQVFIELFNCRLILEKNFYKKYYHENIVVELYKILYNNLDKPKEFINQYLGIVNLDDKEFTDMHNNSIRDMIKKRVKCDNVVWKYVF